MKNNPNPETFDEWYELNENTINIELAESGADREMDFDSEKEFEKRYEIYLENKNTQMNIGGFLCNGCNVREPWEHRCCGENCTCNNPVCMERQGKITHDELMKIVNL